MISRPFRYERTLILFTFFGTTKLLGDAASAEGGAVVNAPSAATTAPPKRRLVTFVWHDPDRESISFSHPLDRPTGRQILSGVEALLCLSLKRPARQHAHGYVLVF